MKNMTEYDRLVWMVGETDDYDGTAAVGMACRACDGVVQVLIQDELNGWWDDEYLPYLVFYRGTRATEEAAREYVEDAIRARTMQSE